MSKANEMAIRVVHDYCIRLERQGYPHWRSPEFAHLSYAKATAAEILSLLKTDKATPPLQTIEEFRDRMNKYSCLNRKTSVMFSVASDIADDIINILIKSYC